MTHEQAPQQDPNEINQDAQAELRNTLDALDIARQHAVAIGDATVQELPETGGILTQFMLEDGTTVSHVKVADGTIRVRTQSQFAPEGGTTNPVALRERDGSVEVTGDPNDEKIAMLGGLRGLADRTRERFEERKQAGDVTTAASNEPPAWTRSRDMDKPSVTGGRIVTPLELTSSAFRVEKHSDRIVTPQDLTPQSFEEPTERFSTRKVTPLTEQ